MVASAPIRTDTFADLHERLGFVPLDRIGLKPPPGTATEADVIRYQEGEPKRLFELVDGVLLEKAVGTRESFLTSSIIGALFVFLQRHNLGILTCPDGLYRMLTRNVRMPDVTFTPWANLPGRRMPKTKVWGVVPGLAVEVLSEANTVQEMERKLVEYQTLGIAVIWIIDPQSETAIVHRIDGGVERLTISDALTAEGVLPGFSLSLAELFAEPMPPDEDPV